MTEPDQRTGGVAVGPSGGPSGGSLGWFAAHEARLAWRDLRFLVGNSQRRSKRGLIIAALALGLFLHWLGYRMFGDAASAASLTDRSTLIVMTGVLIMGWMLMLSQAMEAVTRAFYTRADLELLLSSPVAAWKIFAVRIVAMAAAIGIMSLIMAAPFLNVLAWAGGARWLGGYVVIVAFVLIAVAVAVALTVALFAVIGPRRTRVVAQIVAAVLGAVFIVALQIAAVATYGTISSTVLLRSAELQTVAPELDSLFWYAARAVLGEIPAMLGLLAVSIVLLALSIAVFAPKFGPFAIAAASVGHIGRGPRSSVTTPANFRNRSARQALQRKEWALLRRDPWLASQTLMQVLYLLPAAVLLWQHFGAGVDVAALLVPVLIAAAGQLAGGLAWIAIGGEDAPELIASAPIPPAKVLRAKTEAVMSALAVIFVPFVAVIGLVSARAAFVALIGVIMVAASSTAIQFWFRAQAQRNRMRRRQTSSRLASVTEAMAAIGFAACAAFATAGTWLALIPGGIAVGIVLSAWVISPARAA